MSNERPKHPDGREAPASPERAPDRTRQMPDLPPVADEANVKGGATDQSSPKLLNEAVKGGTMDKASPNLV